MNRFTLLTMRKTISMTITIFMTQSRRTLEWGVMLKLTKAANVFEAKNGTEEKKEQIKAVSVGISGGNTDMYR